jgi:hypothetical protein
VNSIERLKPLMIRYQFVMLDAELKMLK